MLRINRINRPAPTHAMSTPAAVCTALTALCDPAAPPYRPEPRSLFAAGYTIQPCVCELPGRGGSQTRPYTRYSCTRGGLYSPPRLVWLFYTHIISALHSE